MHCWVSQLSRRGQGAPRSPRVPVAVCVGTRSSPRLARAPPVHASAVAPVDELEDNDLQDPVYDPSPGESQPFLFFPAGIVHINSLRIAFVESQLTKGGFMGTRAESTCTTL